MARKPFSIVLEFVRSIGTASGDATDADLLGRFAAKRDEAAFSAILQRHGPLVLGICRRVLANAADAEDAFQATFLVLVRRAGSIKKGDSISCWLHGVAYRVALEARGRAVRGREQEKQATTTPPTDPFGDVATRELRAILDEELEQLPAKYRAPLLLHYFASKTKEETAQDLGWTEGTVSGRLARARDLLRTRLTRRGVTASAAAFSAALVQEAAAMTVAHPLASSTVNLVALVAAGEVAAGASAARILALTDGVVHSMFVTKLKVVTAALLLTVAMGTGAGELLYRAAADSPGDAKKPVAVAPLRAGLPRAFAEFKSPAPVVEADKAESIEDLIPKLSKVEDLLVGPFISTIKQPTTLSGGFRFRFPYDGGGSMKTFLIGQPDATYTRPPKVNASTAEGRKAVFETLRDADKGPHFSMDGKELLAWNDARIVPFNFKDERLRKSWIDAIRRIPPALLVEFVKKQHGAAKRTPGPVERSYVLPLAETSFFAALTRDDRPVILWITRKTDFQYDVGHYLLEPPP